MRIEYKKLIRDKIPEIINKSGKSYMVEVMNEDKYREALLEKLVEEAKEVRNASHDNLIYELADLSEVFDTIMSTYGLSLEQLLIIKETRRNERGGFNDRLELLWADQ